MRTHKMNWYKIAKKVKQEDEGQKKLVDKDEDVDKESAEVSGCSGSQVYSDYEAIQGRDDLAPSQLRKKKKKQEKEAMGKKKKKQKTNVDLVKEIRKEMPPPSQAFKTKKEYNRKDKSWKKDID